MKPQEKDDKTLIDDLDPLDTPKKTSVNLNMREKLLRKEAENVSLAWELSKILKGENGWLQSTFRSQK